MDIKYYPFDEQTCTLTYYVSDETIITVELDHSAEVNLEEFTENSAWAVTSVTRRRFLKYNTYFVDVEFNLQRRANFATFTLVMPLLMLAFLNICIFLVPSGSGEKGSFAITIFLAYGIFVTIVSDTLPDNSLQICYFLLFIIVLLFMSVLSVFYTVVQAKLMSSYGDRECNVKCLRPRRHSKNKVVPFNGGAEKDMEVVVVGSGGFDARNAEVCEGESGPEYDEENYTWGMFLEKLDTVIFVCFFVLILLFSVTFFSLMLQRVSESTLKKI